MGKTKKMPDISQLGGRSLTLPEPVQAKMESAFHADLGNLRLNESPLVSQAGAVAVTQGNTVSFAPGRFNPNSISGQELIGHEISHAVSQARGEVSGSGFLNDSGLESRADSEGVRAARGQSVATGAAIKPMSPSAGNAPMQGKLPFKKPKISGPTNIRHTDQLDITNEILRDNPDSIYNPDFQDRILQQFVSEGKSLLASTERSVEGAPEEQVRLALFSSFRENKSFITNFGKLLHAVAPYLGSDVATARMDLSSPESTGDEEADARAAAEQLAGNVGRSLEDISISMKNNDRFSELLNSVRPMFDGIRYFRDHPEDITNFMTDIVFLRCINPEMMDAAATTNFDWDKKDQGLRGNIKNTSTFLQRTINNTMGAGRAKQVELDAYGILGGDPMAPVRAAIAGAMFGDGEEHGDASWELVRQAQQPGATNDQMAKAYDTMSRQQIAGLTADQKKAGDEYILDSRDTNNTLRGRRAHDANTDKRIRDLQEAMKPIQTPVTVYRTVPDGGFSAMLGQLGMPGMLNQDGSLNQDEFRARRGSLIGKIFTDDGFVSTTMSKDYADHWGKGLPARSVGSSRYRALITALSDRLHEDPQYEQFLNDPTLPEVMKQPIAHQAAQDLLGVEETKRIEGQFSTDKLTYHMMQINLPAGTPALFIDGAMDKQQLTEAYQKGGRQYEVLLRNSCKFLVRGIEPYASGGGGKTNGSWKLILDVLPGGAGIPRH